MTGELRDFTYAVDASFGAVPPTKVVPVHGVRGTEPRQRQRLGEALVAAGVVTPAQLEHALRVQQGHVPRRRLGTVVVDLGLATADDVARGLATILGFEYVDPGGYDVPVEAVRRVPRFTAETLCVVPLGAGDSWLRVAVADPTDRDTLEALREATGLLTISLAVATPRAIEAALQRFWSPEYAPAPATAAAPEPEPDPEPEPATDDEPAGPAWEHLFVSDDDLAATERELSRLGALGWEAVGMTSNGTRLTVLLKRPGR